MRSREYKWVSFRNDDSVSGDQTIQQSLTTSQRQLQSLVVRNSNNINVVQTEAQALVVVQAALQAAIEAAITALGRSNKDVKTLQAISQRLSASQSESQSILIDNSSAITVTQTELQITAVVQAAINLLAEIALKVG
ncbi:spore coat protein [Neobacillus vireti]|uniref:spore coat protein n=1 Tax=Neobacillus vireti TaxID=220686 RepID=UPI002FFED305